MAYHRGAMGLAVSGVAWRGVALRGPAAMSVAGRSAGTAHRLTSAPPTEHSARLSSPLRQDRDPGRKRRRRRRQWRAVSRGPTSLYLSRERGGAGRGGRHGTAREKARQATATPSLSALSDAPYDFRQTSTGRTSAAASAPHTHYHRQKTPRVNTPRSKLALTARGIDASDLPRR